MSEHSWADGSRPDAEAVSQDLTARCGVVALRVAGVLDERCSQASGAREAAAFLRDWVSSVIGGSEPVTSPLDTLVARLELDDVEVTLLLLAGLPDEHEGLATTFRSLSPCQQPRPSVGLAALVLENDVPDRAALRRLLVEGPAAQRGLLTVPEEGPLFERSLVIAEGVWEALHGHDTWPSGLQRTVVAGPPPGLSGWLRLPAVRRAVTVLPSLEDVVVLLTGTDDAIMLSRCAGLAAAAGRRAVAARVTAPELKAVPLLALHAAVRDAVPVVVAGAGPGEGAPGELDLDGARGPVVVCAPPGTVRPGGDRPVLALPLGPIEVADRRAAWRAALPDHLEEAEVLAARHPLDPALTAQVALDLAHRGRIGGRLDLAEVSAVIRARAGIALPAGVDLVTPRVDWTDLVLSPEAEHQLEDAVERLAQQSRVLDDWGLRESVRADRGVRLLFSGPPGTGKSLAAEVIAAAAATDLLVVDVSRIVSKWVGETEKNLAAVFDVAERTQAVLLLDEADALFGARTEISDAHDRYANLETAWLLQRLDRFEGLTVLATNMRQNIDRAFVRRMDYVVEFPLPDEPARLALWEQHVPLGLRADDVDLAMLTRLYPIPGGWIRNAAIAAAFLAAGDGDLVHREHLVTAVRREYGKANKPFPGEPPRPAPGHDQDAVRALAAAATVTTTEERT